MQNNPCASFAIVALQLSSIALEHGQFSLVQHIPVASLHAHVLAFAALLIDPTNNLMATNAGRASASRPATHMTPILCHRHHLHTTFHHQLPAQYRAPDLQANTAATLSPLNVSMRGRYALKPGTNSVTVSAI